MKNYIIFLGNSAAIPTNKRDTGGAIIKFNGNIFLMDPSDGITSRLIKNSFDITSIDYIFISHYHPDHFLGLLGILAYLNYKKTKKKITILSNDEHKDWINYYLRMILGAFPFSLVFFNIDNCNQFVLSEGLYVDFFEVNHNVLCHGINFNKQGSRIITFLGDAYYTPALCNSIRETSILVSETTFESTKKKLAKQYYHMTISDAIKIAIQVNAKQLFIHHFSPRYDTIDKFYSEIKSSKIPIVIAEIGRTYNFN